MEDNKEIRKSSRSPEIRREYEERYKEYLDGFYKIALRILKDYPEQYEEFKKHYELKNYVLARRIYSKFCKNNNISLTSKEKEIADKFNIIFAVQNDYEIMVEAKEKEERRQETREKYGHYLEGFYKIACKILADHPEQYEEFEKQWKLENFRLAFYEYTDIVYKYKTSKYILTPEEKKIEQEFYWVFVN